MSIVTKQDFGFVACMKWWMVFCDRLAATLALRSAKDE